jgi:hypothetical protein
MVWPLLHPRPPTAHGWGGAPAAPPAAAPTFFISGCRRFPLTTPTPTHGAATTTDDNLLTGDVASSLLLHHATRSAPPLALPPPLVFSPSSNSSRQHLRLRLGLRQCEEEGRHMVGRDSTGRVLHAQCDRARVRFTVANYVIWAVAKWCIISRKIILI